MAQDRMSIEYGPEIALYGTDSLGGGIAVVDEGDILIADERHFLDGLRLLFPGDKIAAAHEAVVGFSVRVRAIGAAIVGDPDEAVRIRIRQRLEDDCIDYAEHRGVHSDAEGESQDRGGSKAGIAAQHARA